MSAKQRVVHAPDNSSTSSASSASSFHFMHPKAARETTQTEDSVVGQLVVNIISAEIFSLAEEQRKSRESAPSSPERSSSLDEPYFFYACVETLGVKKKTACVTPPVRWNTKLTFNLDTFVPVLTLKVKRVQQRRNKSDVRELIGASTHKLNALTLLEKWQRKRTSEWQVWELHKPHSKPSSGSGSSIHLVGDVMLELTFIPRAHKYAELEEFLLDPEFPLLRALFDVRERELSYSFRVFLDPFLVFLGCNGVLTPVMKAVILHEVNRVSEPALLLRENRFPSLLFCTYMMKITKPFLRSVLFPLIKRSWVPISDALGHAPAENLHAVAKKIAKTAQIILECLLSHTDEISPDVLRVTKYLAKQTNKKFGDRASRNALGTALFLRLLCPALINPQNYGLLDEPLPTEAQRFFVFVAKVLQQLASDAPMGDSLAYLNPFLDDHPRLITEFYHKIQTYPVPPEERVGSAVPVPVYETIAQFLYDNRATLKSTFHDESTAVRFQSVMADLFESNRRSSMVYASPMTTTESPYTSGAAATTPTGNTGGSQGGSGKQILLSGKVAMGALLSEGDEPAEAR